MLSKDKKIWKVFLWKYSKVRILTEKTRRPCVPQGHAAFSQSDLFDDPCQLGHVIHLILDTLCSYLWATLCPSFKSPGGLSRGFSISWLTPLPCLPSYIYGLKRLFVDVTIYIFGLDHWWPFPISLKVICKLSHIIGIYSVYVWSFPGWLYPP